MQTALDLHRKNIEKVVTGDLSGAFAIRILKFINSIQISNLQNSKTLEC
jgi:hypothetical protein